MVTAMDTTWLREISAMVAARMGLDLPEPRWPDLARGLDAAGRELGFQGPDARRRWLAGDTLTTRQLEVLASHLTVGETYFMRDPESFRVLEQVILPELIARRAATDRTLRLWSAGCATGEEAYSLAIACVLALPDIATWKVSILATDINTAALAKAEAGAYSHWSFRGTPEWLRCRFFSMEAGEKKAGRTATIDPAIRRLVSFEYLNLAEDAYPSLLTHTNGLDLIFCRNVLMYLTPDHQRRVVQQLHKSLVEGGCLLVNPAEAATTLFSLFSLDVVDGVSIHRKSNRPDRVRPRAGHRAAASEPPVVTALPREPVAIPAPLREPVAIPAPLREPVAMAVRSDPLAVARSLANDGSLVEALESCGAAIEADRTDPVAHLVRATICHELGQPAEELAALGRVVYLDPESIVAHHALGAVYRRLGTPAESVRHLTIALELLAARDREEIVPESDGMTCGRLAELIRAMAEV